MRHRAAIMILAAWVLMRPPVLPSADGTFAVDTKAPMTQWHQFAVYDSARGCLEHARVVFGAYMLTVQTENSQNSHELSVAASMRKAKCVPAETLSGHEPASDVAR